MDAGLREYVKWCQENQSEGIIDMMRLGNTEMVELVRANPEITAWYIGSVRHELAAAERRVGELTRQVNLLKARLSVSTAPSPAPRDDGSA